jgi:hypothetical protein
VRRAYKEHRTPILVLVGVASVGVGMQIAAPRSPAVLLLLGILYSLTVLCLSVDFLSSNKRFDAFLVGLCSVFYILGFSGRAILLGVNPDANTVPELVRVEDQIAALNYSYIGLITLIGGYAAGRRWKFWCVAGHRHLSERPLSTASLSVISALAVVGGLVQSLLYYTDTYKQYEAVGAVPGLMRALGGACVAYLLTRMKSQPLWATAVAIASLIGCMFASALRGGRLGSIDILIVVAMYFFLRTERSAFRKRLALLALALITGTVMLLTFNAIRAFKGEQGQSRRLTPIERVRFAIEKYGEIKERSTVSNESFVDVMSARLGTPIEHLAALIAGTPSIWEYQYGATLVLTVTKFIPRALWREKGATNVESRFYTDYLGYTIEAGGGGGASMSTVGDWYLNFHAFGVVGGMALLGLYYRAFQDYVIGRSRRQNSQFAQVFFCHSIGQMMILYNTVAEIVGNSILETAVFLIVVKIASISSGAERGACAKRRPGAGVQGGASVGTSGSGLRLAKVGARVWSVGGWAG